MYLSGLCKSKLYSWLKELQMKRHKYNMQQPPLLIQHYTGISTNARLIMMQHLLKIGIHLLQHFKKPSNHHIINNIFVNNFISFAKLDLSKTMVQSSEI